jgi:predicted nucleic acid-binding protein
MIVVDTNIIGYLYLNNAHSPQAEQTLRKDSLWATPYLWRSELRNVLAHYLRRNLLAPTDAQLILDEALHLM